MKLAKPHLDVAVMTDQPEAMLRFWQETVGLAYEEALPTGGGNLQHRHGVNGSVFKLNHPRKGLPATPPSGYRSLWIARDDLDERRECVDPDGNRVVLVPRGEDGIEGIAVGVAVRDPQAQARFYVDGLGLEEVGADRYRCGDSLLQVEHDPEVGTDHALVGRGYRYLTIQVHDCAAEHARVLAAGGLEGAPPRRHGDVAIFSMVRDPDGSWVEISQRGSLTGGLPPV